MSSLIRFVLILSTLLLTIDWSPTAEVFWQKMLLLSPETAAAGIFPGGEGVQWSRGPVVVSKNNPNFLLLPIDVGGLYCSLDTGKEWNLAMSDRNARDTNGFAINSPVVIGEDKVILRAGILSRTIYTSGRRLLTTSIQVNGHELLAGPIPEAVFRVRRAEPNLRPRGLKLGEGATVQSEQTFSGGKLDPARWEDRRPEATHWIDAVDVSADRWQTWASAMQQRQILDPKSGARRLVICTPLKSERTFGRLAVTTVYETFEGHPAVRKWIEIENSGDRWLILDHLKIDAVRLSERYQHITPLALGEEGSQPCVVGFGDAARSRGVIAASEVPSALRSLDEDGAMGYNDQWFEWVIGPGETFVSEPVFLYAYAGATIQTPSALSTPLDRAVEGPYIRFVHQHVGVAADRTALYAPQWLSWAVFHHRINDALMRTQADLAARAGFAQVLFDDGWQKDRLGTEVDSAKFPDMASTSLFIRSRGLSLGLWVSCFRSDDSVDLREVPDGRSLPLVKRANGWAMSFLSPWQAYYAQDLARVAREFGVTYFKQDFSNVRFGDIAESHEGRTLRDSLLRGLRNLLKTQDRIRELAPQVVTELTHEIYWHTPGVSADLAVLKHACQYHFPYNACWGADPIYPEHLRPASSRRDQIDPETHRSVLRQGCFEARKRFYAQRGLPLSCLEYYAAATQSVGGSLTPAVQDRQIVSWLMGAPLNFSGDLCTLSEVNIAHYRQRFDLLKRLQERYDIYRHFQFSGVPPPTDEDWHWWGKLNNAGYGAVVVLRGKGGKERRMVNIPWVERSRRYRLTTSLSGTEIGEFSGKDLQDNGIALSLPPLGQEIIEVAAP